jgi:hypothetical protein
MQGSLDAFARQRGNSGPAFSWKGAAPGKTYEGFVSRGLVDDDVRHQTNDKGDPQNNKDGSPKWVMIVPMLVSKSTEFPDGFASWWIHGQAKDELSRAMSAAGAASTVPEAGAFIRVTFTGQKLLSNGWRANQFRVEYQRPEGDAAALVSAVEPPAEVTKPVSQETRAVAHVDAAPSGAGGDKQALLNRLIKQQG